MRSKDCVYMNFNPLDYFYYKLYIFWEYLFNDRNVNYQIIPIILVVLSSNVFSLILSITGELTDKAMYVSGGAIMIFLVLRFDSLESRDKYIAKYKDESEKSRVLGNLLVTLYVLASLLILVLLIKYYYNV